MLYEVITLVGRQILEKDQSVFQLFKGNMFSWMKRNQGDDDIRGQEGEQLFLVGKILKGPCHCGQFVRNNFV